MVQLSYKVTSACVSLASFMRVTRAYHALLARVTCVARAYLACHSRVANLRVHSTTVYFYSSFSLQVTSELANSRSKQTTVLG